MNKYLHYFFVLFLFVFAENSLAAQVVRYVNVDKILRESPQAIESANKLKKEFSARAEAIANLQKKLEGMEKSGETNQSKINDLRLNIEQMRRDMAEDGDRRKSEELETLQDRINKAVAAVSESEKCDLVLYTGLAYINKKNQQLDLTDKVIKLMGTSAP